MTSRSIAILGAGQIGQPLSRHWASTGHRVTLGSRRPEVLADVSAANGVVATTHRKAVETADIVVLSVPHSALAELLDSLDPLLDGRIVIDTTNPMTLSPDGRITSELGERTQGSATADRLPGARVVRAFSHVMDELLWPRGTVQRHFWGMAYAGDDEEAKEIAASLISDAGFVPVDLGSLGRSRPLDPGGALFPHMFTPADLRVAAGLTTAGR